MNSQANSVRASRRSGTTLVELLVVTAIVAVLMGILLPSLTSARAAAHASTASSHLSSFARGFALFAEQDGNGRFSSGAFDHLLDGDIRTRGWVADLLRLKAANPGKARDPANRWQVSETVADYTGAARRGTTVALDGSHNGWSTTNYAAVSGSAYFGSIQAMNEIWNDGYNATFATTWHFSRGDPTTTLDESYPGYGSVRGSPVEGCGPLSTAVLNRSNTTAARVALMGPARATDGPEFMVRPGAVQLRTGVADGVVNSFVGLKLVRPRDLLLESFTDGMNVAFTDPAIGGRPGCKIHDLSDIHPLHQPKNKRGGGGFAPILFADGHVERVHDTVTVSTGSSNGDSFIGNAVKVSSSGIVDSLVLDGPSYQEAADQIWLRRLETATLPDGTTQVE